MQRVLTTVTLLGLLVATAAAFAITEHLKLIKSPVYGTLVSKVLSPACHCATSKATIRIRLRHPDRVTVRILDSSRHVVATVVTGARVPRSTPTRWFWHGRTDAGTLASDGVYYPEVHLANARRTILFPNRIVLDTTPPKVLSVNDGKGVLLAGPKRMIEIRYVFDEPAHAVVYLDGRRIIRGHRSRPRDAVKWDGKLDGRPLPAGAYVLSIGGLDLAGNETPAVGRKTARVVIRYIDLTPRVLDVRPGAHLAVHVVTSAPRYTWRLGHRHGARSMKVLRLGAPTTPGTYRLVVDENGHTATTLVRVRAR